MSRCVSLKPRLGERIRELPRIFVEALGDRAIDRVHPQERSVVSITGVCRFDGSWASGTAFAAAPFLGTHWFLPAGLFAELPLISIQVV